MGVWCEHASVSVCVKTHHWVCGVNMSVFCLCENTSLGVWCEHVSVSVCVRTHHWVCGVNMSVFLSV